ncbi:MAG: 16S rRNA (uracil(1498)-N(3))-methyltransferase [Gammaproteobacteria bacterium]|nr:16S rRNA (uracil(1498)-N(3))-methyltransferase [Gammaproteobacteria bacterium]
MAVPTFFHAHLTAADSVVELERDEASHAIKSRRLKAGQRINLINGRGLKAGCTIAEHDRHRMSVRIEQIEKLSLPSRQLTIACAIPKGDRQRTLIDILTQNGISRFIPLECEHTVIHFKDNFIEKWQRVAREACKQSQNCWLPEFQSARSIPQILQWLSQQTNTQGLYADGRGQKMSALAEKSDHLTVLVGPEGGFSAAELESFEQAELKAVRLADCILRTEAAAINAAAQFFAL